MLDIIEIRAAENGYIVRYSWTDGEGDAKEWHNDEQVFLDKAGMEKFIADKVNELT